MTASINSSAKVSPSLQTAADRNGTCNNKHQILRYIYLDKNGCNGDDDSHDKDDCNEDGGDKKAEDKSVQGDLGSPVDEPGVGDQLLVEPGQSTSAAVAPWKWESRNRRISTILT